jgi:hypothetical protein
MSRPSFHLPILVLGALLALVGCATPVVGRASPAPASTSAPSTAPTAEDRFYADVMDTPGLTSTVSRDDLVTVGNQVCEIIGMDGVTYESLVAQLGTSKWGPEVMRVVVDAAHLNLCPGKPYALSAAAPTVASPVPAGPATTAGDGTYEVGVDLEPGRYKTAGPDQSSVIPNCYWARTKDDSGEFGSIIANQNLQGPGSVTVKEGEFVNFAGGCSWTKS